MALFSSNETGFGGAQGWCDTCDVRISTSIKDSEGRFCDSCLESYTEQELEEAS
jgi:hypothetical protein